MIVARKSGPFNFVLRRWLDRVLRRRFFNVYIGGAEHLRALNGTRPVVGCVNHTNWWDGFVLYVLSHRCLPHDIHLAMEEANLRRYRFFTWMGVFGVDLSARGAAWPALRYATGLLEEKSRAGAARLIWMFVQGRLLRAGRPVEVKPGARYLARRGGALILPLVLRYEWLVESRPSIFVHVGPAVEPTISDDELAALLNGLLARLDATLDPLDLSGYEPLYRPSLSINKRWDRLRHRFLRRAGPVDERNG